MNSYRAVGGPLGGRMIPDRDGALKPGATIEINTVFHAAQTTHWFRRSVYRFEGLNLLYDLAATRALDKQLPETPMGKPVEKRGRKIAPTSKPERSLFT